MQGSDPVLEAVVNISEGRDPSWLGELATATRGCLDLHQDHDHHRSVLTLVGEVDLLIESVLALSHSTIEALDLTRHSGVHPRIGLVDVVPFVPLGSATMLDAMRARDRCAQRLGDELSLPCFLYGPLSDGTDRTLPEIRREAFRSLTPDAGPREPDPMAGAVAVGARPLLLAWNIWLRDVSIHDTKAIARQIRSPAVRSLGLQVGSETQVSCNLIDLAAQGPAQVFDQVECLLDAKGSIQRCELVGLAPMQCVTSTPRSRLEQLDLSVESTIEWRSQAAQIDIV